MKVKQYSIRTGVEKTIKNYLIPFAGMSVAFLASNCNPEATLITGLTLGSATALIQNYLKMQK